MRLPTMKLFRSGLRRWWRARFGWRWFRGDYGAWAQAREASAGYDDAAVLAQAQQAARDVRAGRALWERDGTLFHAPAFNEPLLAALATLPRPLDVVDFGGALGSTWWQHRARLGQVRWHVVEQPHYVSAGREFEEPALRFHASLAEAVALAPARVILFSSVLQYLPEPRRLLEQADQAGFEHIIIDRTGFISAPRTRLAVQRTPPALGGGSYPCWLFQRAELLAPLAAHYELVAEWPALDELSPEVSHRGLHFRRRT